MLIWAIFIKHQSYMIKREAHGDIFLDFPTESLIFLSLTRPSPCFPIKIELDCAFLFNKIVPTQFLSVLMYSG
jgi:hypothetical protein